MQTMSRRSKSGSVLLAIAILLATLSVEPRTSTAIEGGSDLSNDAPNWAVALIRVSGVHWTSCSGSLIAHDAVLTAAHCVNGDSPSDWKVTVGRGDLDSNSQGVERPVRSISVHPSYAGPDDSCCDQYDLAVLRIDSVPANYEILPISATAPPDGLAVSAFGYGLVNDGNFWGLLPNQSRELRRSQDGDYQVDVCAGAGLHFCVDRLDPSSNIHGGDSGAPWVSWEDGAWVQYLVHSGSGPDPEIAVATGGSLGPLWHWLWIKNEANLFTAPSGTIVRDQATGDSWLVESDLKRHWIHDGGTFECLEDQGHPVVNTTRQELQAIPDNVGDWATCVPANPGGGENDELLTDGGFGGLTAWGQINLPWATNIATITDATQAYSGSRHLRSATTQAGGSVGQDITTSVAAGRFYRFRVWARSDQPATARVQLWARGGAPEESAGHTVRLTNRWTPIDVVLRPTGNHTSLRAEMYMQTTNVDFRWDHASVRWHSSSPPIFAKDPFGAYDLAVAPSSAAVRVRGWGLDPSAWDDEVHIHAYVGGAAGAPGTEGHSLGPASALRLDVANAYPWVSSRHGYDFTFTTSKLGRQPVCVYLINIGEGSNTSLGCKTVTVVAVPSAPAALNGAITETGVDLSWSAASANGAAVDSYEVEIERTTSVPFVGTFSAGNALSYRLPISWNGTYRYRVRAHNVMGWGPWSPSTGNLMFDRNVVISPSIAESSVVEGDSGTATLEIPVRLSVAASEVVTASWSTEILGLTEPGEGAATQGVDYLPGSGTLEFNPGETEKTIYVTINGDVTHEPTVSPGTGGESVLVQLTNLSSNAQIGTFFGIGVGLIVDDDSPPLIIPGSVGGFEGDAGLQVFDLPVTLSNPSDENVTVEYISWPLPGAGFATEGVDYVPIAPGTLTFLPGETVKSVEVTVYGDTEIEEPLWLGEWLLVSFRNPSANSQLATSFFGLGVGIIADDD